MDGKVLVELVPDSHAVSVAESLPIGPLKLALRL